MRWLDKFRGAEFWFKLADRHPILADFVVDAAPFVPFRQEHVDGTVIYFWFSRKETDEYIRAMELQ